ncbi:MAG: alpha/beta hydrolase [Treponema sp.]|nr:alpha/beta hydrolase [Treponema sp.]
MSLVSFIFKKNCKKSDTKRDANLVAPENVTAVKDIPYAAGGKYNLLDVYYPKGISEKLPVIVSIHGGGYVYGTKEVYFHYGMYLASLGFTVVNFNYHLAPRFKFPSQLGEINTVFEWISKNAEQYYMDTNNVFVVGDSAGAQLNSHYAAIYSNPEFAKLFDFKVPRDEIKIRAVALNCGLYALEAVSSGGSVLNTNQLQIDYLGKKLTPEKIKMLDVLGNITSDFPPSFVMTAEYDFLKQNAQPMADFLKSKGVENECHLYGKEDQNYMAHVFHVNMNLEEAKVCNQDETAFFRRFLVK